MLKPPTHTCPPSALQPEVVCKACHLIGSMAFDNRENQAALDQLGVMSALVGLLKTTGEGGAEGAPGPGQGPAASQPMVLVDAARALGNMAFNNDRAKLAVAEQVRL